MTTPEERELLVERVARKLLDVRGFGFYLDPMEGGENAYYLTLEALEEAEAVVDILREPVRSDDSTPEELLRDTLASLVAAVSLLRRGGKRAAASDRIFNIMLNDYEASIERARSFFRAKGGVS